MRILFVSAEVAPFAKVGGLADVAGGLPRALQALGHEPIIFMPAYGMVLNDERYGPYEKIASFEVRMNATRSVEADLYEFHHNGVRHWMLCDGKIREKTKDSESLYSLDRDEYLFYSAGALEACLQTGWHPDVVHVNDWHTGFLPVLMREGFSRKEWERTASVFTIHNLAHQGEFDEDTLEAAGLPMHLFNGDQLETWGRVNFLKSGCVFSDVVNTVSDTYSREICTDVYGCTLHGLMLHLLLNKRLYGIVNGIDTKRFDPASDPDLPANYSLENLEGKAKCRTELAKEMELKVDDQTPVLGVVSRLSFQKGFDLIVKGAPEYLDKAALVVLGLGDPSIAKDLRKLEVKYPGRVRFVEKFDVQMAQRIYAGSDMFLMPSSFEPCGLGQLIAMRYGTVPVVRETGGLADTVFEGRNGFSFIDHDEREFAAATNRGIKKFRDDKKWRNLVLKVMKEDHSWLRSARNYVAMYKDAQAMRKKSLSGRVRVI
jgi:starch synthase